LNIRRTSSILGSLGSYSWVLALTLSLFLVPCALDLALSDPSRAFGWVAPDTFYYLVYAQQTLGSGIISYDGVHWSNGFHPLWMALLTLLQSMRSSRGTYIDLYWVLALSALCQVGAFILWSRVLRRRDGSLSSWFLALPVGFYAAFVCPFWLRLSAPELARQDPWSGPEPVYGSSWAFTNGLESSLALLLLASVASGFCTFDLRTSRRQALALGALIGALMLARLDQLFIAGSLWLGIGLMTRPWQGRRALTNWLWFSATPIVLLGLYMVTNRWLFDSALPISGKMKSSFPFVEVESFRQLAQVYNSLVGGERPPIWVYWRVLQCLVPALFALLTPFVAVEFRWRRRRFNCGWALPGRVCQFVVCLAPGVLALAVYNFAFVHPMHTGHWYYPLSTFFVSLICLVALERLTRALEATSVTQGKFVLRMRSGLRLALQVVLVGASLAFFIRLHRRVGYNQRYAQFYFEERDLLREAFRGHEPHLLCVDDGIVEYVSGFPSMSGTGLALDAPAAKAQKQGQLLQFAQKRGFDHVTSLVYLDANSLREQPPNFEAWKRGAGILGDFRQQKFELAYLSKNLNFGIVRVERKPLSPRTRSKSR